MSEPSSGQMATPPLSGGSQSLALVIIPAPQVFEQDDQGCQAPQLPSEQEMNRVFFRLMLYLPTEGGQLAF